MRLKSGLAAASVLMGALAMSGTALAGVSGNAAMSSDYLWRGLTQTGNAAAVSGGLDYGHDSGVYAGTWASNVAGDTEIDVYGGFSKEFGGLGIDLGGIYYHYPDDWEDFYEGYLGLSFSMVGATVYYNPEGSFSGLYATAGLDYEITKGVSVGVSGGYAMPDAGGEYMHYGLSLTKSMDAGDFSVMVSDTDMETGADAKPTMVVSFSKGFDF